MTSALSSFEDERWMLPYEPLPNARWIRLLTLKSATYSGDPSIVKVNLHMARLEDADYEAISYYWVHSTLGRDIDCNGVTRAIPLNLYNALRKLQPAPGSKDRVLWADPICIDRSDEAELNSQISMRGSIFKNAKSVQIWLGHDLYDDARPAFELCQEIRAYYSDGYHSDEDSTWFDLPDSPSSDASFLDPSRWRHLQTLSQLPWFTGLWGLQEVGLAQAADVHWGGASTKFSELMEAFTHINLHSCLISLVSEYGFDFSSIHNWWQIGCTYDTAKTWKNECPYSRFATTHPDFPQRQDLLSILLLGSRFKAGAPHDYIYAHLSHPAALREGVTPFVKVDYTQFEWNLYADVDEYFLNEKYGLLLLSAVQHQERIFQASWMPMWDDALLANLIAPIPGSTRWYDASLTSDKTENPPKPASVNGVYLTVRGVVLDTVSACSNTFERTADSIAEHPVVAALALDQTPLDAEKSDALSLVLIAGMDGNSGKAAEDDIRKHRANFQAYCLQKENLELVHQQLYLKEIGDGNVYKRNLDYYCKGRRVFRTADGRFGLGPAIMREGDQCCVLLGSSVPFIIRRAGTNYKLVGECYIHGVMRGEIVKHKLQAQQVVEDIVLE